ncbi:MAG: Cof-type HAD-IIB family hydrolase [Candidatus Acidiferrales bacterium]
MTPALYNVRAVPNSRVAVLFSRASPLINELGHTINRAGQRRRVKAYVNGDSGANGWARHAVPLRKKRTRGGFDKSSNLARRSDGAASLVGRASGYNQRVGIRLIAMDIDGTLLDSRGNVSEDNARTIAEAAARGIEIVLVTGRRFDFARPVAERLACDWHLIVNNGALIKSKSGETFLRRLLSGGTARRVLEMTGEYRESAAVIFDRPHANQVIMEHIEWDDPHRGGYFRRNREYMAEVEPLENCLDGEDPIQVLYTGPCREMRGAMEALEDSPGAGEYTLALTEYERRDFSILDVLRRGVSKGVALEDWARRRGVERKEVMAIGDNWNDREMLEFAGLPVVMGNSIAELKSLGYPVTLSNDESGVAEAIRTFAMAGAPRGVAD